jgi:hypothetical protein
MVLKLLVRNSNKKKITRVQVTEQLQSQWHRVVKLLEMSPERHASLASIATKFANSIDEFIELDGEAFRSGKRQLVAAQESKIDILETWSTQLETMRQELELLELCSQWSMVDTKADVTPKLVPTSLLSPDILTLTPESKAADSTSRKRLKIQPSSSHATVSGRQPYLAKESDDDHSWHTAASLSSSCSTIFIGQASPSLQCMRSTFSGSSCYNLAERFNDSLESSIPMLSEPPSRVEPQAALLSTLTHASSMISGRCTSRVQKQQSGMALRPIQSHASRSTPPLCNKGALSSSCKLTQTNCFATAHRNDLEQPYTFTVKELWEELLKSSSTQSAIDPEQLIDLLCEQFMHRIPTTIERYGHFWCFPVLARP